MEGLLVLCIFGAVIAAMAVHSILDAMGRALNRSLIRRPLNDLLALDNSSTWILESIDKSIHVEGQEVSPPPRLLTIVGDRIARLVCTAEDHLLPVYEVNEAGLLSAFHRAYFGTEGRVLDLRFGSGAIEWSDFSDSSSEVVWVTWRWELMPDAKRNGRIRDTMLAVVPGADSLHVRVIWGVIDREVTPRVDAESESVTRERSLTRCVYRAVLNVEDELSRWGDRPK